MAFVDVSVVISKGSLVPGLSVFLHIRRVVIRRVGFKGYGRLAKGSV
jgi:hypothetical protein